MSYEDDFKELHRTLEDADSFARNMGMGMVLLEIPFEWFERHGVSARDYGIQGPYPFVKSVLLGEVQVLGLWKKSTPKTRWKEVYG